jgi:hypothetical protein
MPQNDNSEKKFQSFFEKDIRKNLSEVIDLEYTTFCFKDIFERYNTVFTTGSTYEENPFFKSIAGLWELNMEEMKPKTELTCDEIFYVYLKEVASKTNREYFHFIFKFVVLFRECINKLKRSEKSEENLTPALEYSQTANAETVPDTCNEFITEFMDPNDYYGLDTGELIEAIQHLCFWLYFNQFTTSRLTLL